MRTTICTLLAAAALASVAAGCSTVRILAQDADCGEWMSTRQTSRALALEYWVVGMLDGMTLASSRQFWRANATPAANRESVFVWMDDYCRTRPANRIATGVTELFGQRAGDPLGSAPSW
jgi:hypothetical protein